MIGRVVLLSMSLATLLACELEPCATIATFTFDHQVPSTAARDVVCVYGADRRPNGQVLVSGRYPTSETTFDVLFEAACADQNTEVSHLLAPTAEFLDEEATFWFSVVLDGVADTATDVTLSLGATLDVGCANHDPLLGSVMTLPIDGDPVQFNPSQS